MTTRDAEQLPDLHHRPGETMWLAQVGGVCFPAGALCDLASVCQKPTPVDWTAVLLASAALQACLNARDWATLPLAFGTLSLALRVPFVMRELTVLLEEVRAATAEFGPQGGFTTLAHRVRVLCES